MVPRSSGIVRRCGASKEKSCGGNAAKNRLNFPCSNRRATGGVPYGIGVGSSFQRATPRRLSQAEIALTDSALASAYGSAGSMKLGKKSSKACLRTHILFPARQQDQVGMSAADRLGCDAVNFDFVRRRNMPGKRNHAAGAYPYARAGETKRRKLLA